MNLTRRGWGVVAIVVVAELLALLYGARALNAVVAPAVVALVAAAVQARRFDPPTAERTPLAPGFPDDERSISIDIEGGGVASIEESVPDGLAAEGASAETTLPTTVTYTLTYAERGEHTLGPLTVRVRDVLGLVERIYRVGSTQTVLVYPRVYQMAGRGTLLRTAFDRAEVERQEFDALREYAPGDPTRNINWKATAKDPEEIYVTEFAGRTVDDDFVVAATAEPGPVDAMAEPGAVNAMAAAAASVAVAALDAGLTVELRLPDRTVPAGRGEDHRETVLAALARTGTERTSGLQSYDLPDGAAEDADAVVEADPTGATVTVGDRSLSLEELATDGTNPLAARKREVSP